ncbi:MAG: hypothetical protein HY262_09500 [Chloroflexi bacterium]|nr:hypothetical protein [Chloroflexota bacterium]
MRIGDVKDLAGNRVSQRESWTFVPLAPSDLEAAPVARTIVVGGSTRIDLTLSGAPAPAEVQVLAATALSSTYDPMTSLELINGHGWLVVTPPTNATYRFTYAGAFGVGSATLDVPILVRRTVGLVVRSGALVSKANVGASVKLAAAIGPAVRGVSVSFRLYRFDAIRRIWRYAGSSGRNTDATGQARLTWTPSQPGSYYWRVWVSSTAEFANNLSPVYRWSVSR